MKVVSVKKTLLLLLSLTCLLLLGCQEDYSKELIRGYSLDRLNGFERVISDRRLEVIVNPTVVKYSVVSGFIIGFVETPEFGIKNDSVPGYFVLNTKNGELFQGLNEEAFKLKLDEFSLQRFDWIIPD